MPDSLSQPPRWLPEFLLIWVIFGLIADGPPPGVNEAHYLTKARHYWDPSFCAGDLFLESADAHLMFYWTFGWLTQLTTLGAAAWIGRLVVWGLLASGWQRLSAALLPFRWISVLSAVGYVLLQRNLHMAGEWVVGGVEAKCFAYGLVWHAMALIVKGRWRGVWPLLGAATAFHVLVGGWSMVAAGLAFLWDRDHRDFGSNFLMMLVGLAFALLGLWPALKLDSSVDATTAAAAAEIYVFKRLPHHLAFTKFKTIFLIRMGLAVIVWLLLWQALPKKVRREGGWRRFHWFVAGAAMICLIGVGIDLFVSPASPQRAAQLLRFYFYRVSDTMVPMAIGLGLLYQLTHLQAPILRRLFIGMTWAAVMWMGGRAVLQNWSQPLPGAFVQLRKFVPVDERPEQFRQWLAMNKWLRENTPTNARLLAPRGQQTLKWYGFRGEVSNWKDVPQDAAEVVRWYDRQRAIFPREAKRSGLTAWSDAELIELMRRYEADYLLLDRDKSKRTPNPKVLRRVYPEEGESVFEVYQPTEPREAAGKS